MRPCGISGEITTAGTRGPSAITIDAAYVDAKLAELAKDEDLARYVL